jgi:glutathione synthase/RimK-type ligase-like ATP-grasp enzyme
MLLDRSRPDVVTRNRSLDIQARLGLPRGGRHADHVVVVCTCSEDPDVDDLSLRLAAAAVPLVRVDSDRPGSVDIHWDGRQVVLSMDGRALRPALTWRRSFHATSWPVAGADERMRQYARDQVQSWSRNLTQCCGVDTINAGAVLYDAPNRVTQLAEARRHGLPSAACVVTRDVRAALRVLPGCGDLIVKAIGDHFVEAQAGIVAPLIPRRITREELADMPLQVAPVLVQEFVEHERELRVHVVDGQVFAFSLLKPTLDATLRAPDTVVVETAQLPADLSARLVSLTAACGLDLAAVDLLDTGSDHVFLEINASGSGRFFEQQTRTTAVSEATAALVRARYEAAASRMAA